MSSSRPIWSVRLPSPAAPSCLARLAPISGRYTSSISRLRTNALITFGWYSVQPQPFRARAPPARCAAAGRRGRRASRSVRNAPGPGQELVQPQLQLAVRRCAGACRAGPRPSAVRAPADVVPGQVGAAAARRPPPRAGRRPADARRCEGRRSQASSQLAARGEVVAERPQVVLERRRRAGRRARRWNRVEQRPRAGAGDEAGRRRGQLLDEVLPGQPGAPPASRRGPVCRRNAPTRRPARRRALAERRRAGRSRARARARIAARAWPTRPGRLVGAVAPRTAAAAARAAGGKRSSPAPSCSAQQGVRGSAAASWSWTPRS